MRTPWVLALLSLSACKGDKPAEPQPASATKAADPVAGGSNQAATPAPTPTLPAWILIRVGRVRVDPATKPWDGERNEVSLKKRCTAVAELVGVVRPDVGGVGQLVCLLFDENQKQTDPTLPDLQVLLRAHDTSFRSYIAWDQTAHTFDYSFAVPRDAISESGVVVAIVDADDGSEMGQEIGSIRLSRDELISAVKTTKVLPLKSPGLDLVEVQVEPHDGGFRKQVLKLDTSKGLAAVQSFPVQAGDVVRIEAEGSWTIGRLLSNSAMGPSGVSGDDDKGGRLGLETLRDTRNGAAIAMVGRNGSLKPVAVTPCAKFVAPFSGTVLVGINDRKYSDNRGTAQFTIMKRGATAAQWAAPGTLIDCE